MLFAKFASTLLSAALLASGATARVALPKRDAATDALTKQCSAAANVLFKKDTSLVARGGDFVDVGKELSGKMGTELETKGLATCQGIAVVGKYDDDDNEGDAVFLAHVGATSMDPVDKLVAKVKAAQGKGLKDIKIVVGYCNADSVPSDLAAIKVGEALSKVNEAVLAKVAEISGAKVTEKEIDWDETASLEIDDDGEIDFDKKILSVSV